MIEQSESFDSNTQVPVAALFPKEDSRKTSSFENLSTVLTSYFYKPDLTAIRIVLGTIQAHRLNIGDPAWLFVVAPPGCGKTTMSIMGACGLPEVRMLGDFTENTFLSGFYGHKEPGVLEKLGRTEKSGDTSVTHGNAVFMAKDFTTVLSMRREKRAAILGQLREIHDGEFRRAFGTGETKIWKGRVTIVAAVTPALDTHYSVFSVLGERFLQVRWHRPDSEDAGIWAIQQQGNEASIREKLVKAYAETFDQAAMITPQLSHNMQRRLASLAEIIALARTHIFRNSYGSREIEFTPEAEANTRISKGLAGVAKGIASVMQHTQVEESDLQDSFRVGLDCLQDYRRKVFLSVTRRRDVRLLSIPQTMLKRELENLQQLNIIEEIESNFVLTPRIAKLWHEANIVLP